MKTNTVHHWHVYDFRAAGWTGGWCSEGLTDPQATDRRTDTQLPASLCAQLLPQPSSPAAPEEHRWEGPGRSTPLSMTITSTAAGWHQCYSTALTGAAATATGPHSAMPQHAAVIGPAVLSWWSFRTRKFDHFWDTKTELQLRFLSRLINNWSKWLNWLTRVRTAMRATCWEALDWTSVMIILIDP